MKIRPILLIIVAVAQLLAAYSMIYKRERVLQKGTSYKFECRPIDPEDPFRGKYIRLGLVADRIAVDTLTQWESHDFVYAILDTDSANNAIIKDITKELPPQAGDYLHTHIDYVHYNDSNQVVHLNMPFDRYYMEETKAPVAETIVQRRRNDTLKTEAIVHILNGNAVLSDVLVNDQPIKDYVAEYMAKQRDQ